MEICFSAFSLVVVLNENIVEVGVFKLKRNPPLVIYSHAPYAFSWWFEFFKSVDWRYF